MRKQDKKIQKLNDKIEAWFNYYSDNISSYTFNITFSQGSQWESDTKAYYAANGKAMLTNNLIGKYTKQIVGEQLKTTPEMQIVVDSSAANQQKVALRQDLLRTIQIKNNSKECYETGFETALMGGWGALYFYTDYEEGLTFNQEIKQDVVKTPALCFWDPKAKEKTKADGDIAGIINYMRKSEFERKYPNAQWTTENWINNAMDQTFFINQDSEDEEFIAIADCYEKRYTKKKIVMVSPTISGEKFDVIPKDKFDEYIKNYIENVGHLQMLMGVNKPVELPQIIHERMVDDYVIKCYRMTRVEILEEYDFPSRYLPVIYIDGYSYVDSGKQITKSFTQDAHDAQKAFNYFWSELAQQVRTFRRETVYGTDTMFGGSLQQLQNPEKPAAYVSITPDPTFNGGTPIFREARPLAPELIAACNEAELLIQKVLGRTESSMGDQGNEISGVAIENRLMQQNTMVNKYFDGLLKAIEQAGKLINDLINNIYDQPRDMLLYKDDNKAYNVKLNNYNEKTGEVENEIIPEDYAIRISVGANYEMMRREERQYLIDLMQVSQNPMFSKLGDLYASLSDTPIMPKIVERIKTTIDPQILAKEAGQPAPPPAPPPPQLMLEQQKLQNQAQETQVKAMQAQIDSQRAKMDFMTAIMDLQSKGIAADAEVKKAEVEFGRDLAQKHLDTIGHGVNALGHIKDLAAYLQPEATQQASNAGQT